MYDEQQQQQNFYVIHANVWNYATESFTFESKEYDVESECIIELKKKKKKNLHLSKLANNSKQQQQQQKSCLPREHYHSQHLLRLC